MKIEFNLSPTQYDFVESQAEVVALIGPQGEGKTFAGGARVIRWASSRPKDRPLRGCLIRDKGTNIRDHTIPSLLKAFGHLTKIKPLSSSSWKWIGPKLETTMFGIDSLSDLSRLQGPEWDFIWLEEPAPIIGGASSGLSEEVFTIGYSRMRGGNSKKWLQVTMNPADEEHWTYRYFETDPLPSTEVFHIPYQENVYLSEADRQRVVAAFRDRPDLAARYVRGEWGSVQVGEAVTPEYQENTHRSKYNLDPLPIAEAMRWWDGWHNPTCIFVQRTPRGKILVLDTLRGENMGIRQLIRTQVKPLIQRRYARITQWRDIGDETMKTPDQSDTSVTAAGVIDEELGARFEPCSNAWEPRREAMKTLLNMMIDGEPMLQISRHEKILHQALRGGWHYLKTPTGVVRDKPVKNIHSHPGDAFSYGAVTLLPWKPQIKLPSQAHRMAVARSYAVR
jgi:hypothetical protein